VTSCFEEGNELQRSIKYGEFFDQLRRTPLRGIVFPSVILPILLAMLKLQNKMYIKRSIFQS